MLVLDATGKVVAGNQAARHLWAVADKGLVGSPFSALLSSATGATDVDSETAQWAALRAATLDRSASLSVQPRSGPSRAARVRLERAVGGAGSYIATIQPEADGRRAC